MTPEAWFAGVAVLFSIGGPLVAYGALRQKTADLELRLSRSEAAIEAKSVTRDADREAVIRLEEQMKHLQATLDRMDSKLTEALREKRAPRRAPA